MSEDKEKKALTTLLSLLSFAFLVKKILSKKAVTDESQKIKILVTTMIGIEDMVSISESEIISGIENVNVNSSVTIYLMGV